MLPGVWAKVSQIDGPLPSSFQAPSIWYDEVATPYRKPSGNPRVTLAIDSVVIASMACLSWCRYAR